MTESRSHSGKKLVHSEGLGDIVVCAEVEGLDLANFITAANRTDRPGAVFTITLPVPKPAARLDTAA